MKNDKRAVERVEFFIVVEFRPAEGLTGPYLGITRNFSSEGFSFESLDFDLEPGESLEFSFKQPQSDLIVTVQGEIIWKERADNLQCLTGVRFRDIDDDKILKIMEIVSAAGVAASEFFDIDDISEDMSAGNGDGQDVSTEKKLPSKEPVNGNGRFDAAEMLTHTEQESSVLPGVETEDKPETGPSALRKKKASVFLALAAFLIGIILFVTLKDYNPDKLISFFTNPSDSEENVQMPGGADGDRIQEETIQGDSGQLLQQTGPEEGNVLTDQSEAPVTDRTIAVAPADKEVPESAPDDLRAASDSEIVGEPQKETVSEEPRPSPEKVESHNIIQAVDRESSLSEKREKQPLLLAGELMKEKSFIQKSEIAEQRDSAPGKERPAPALPVTAGESIPKPEKGESDSSVHHEDEKTSGEDKRDTVADMREPDIDILQRQGEETMPAVASGTASEKEQTERPDMDAAPVLQDVEETRTAALDETQLIKKEKIEVLDELFDGNKNWDVFNTFAASGEMRDGKYIIENKRKKGAHFTFSHNDFPHDRDFITEVDIKPGKTIYSHSYGFVLGAQDVDNNYIFRIINNRYFLISKYHKGILQNLAGGTIEKGVVRADSFNTLKIEKRGRTIRFYVNDQFIEEISGISFDGGKVGFVIEGNMSISVDRMHSQIISY